MRTQGQIALLNALDLALEKGQTVKRAWQVIESYEIEEIAAIIQNGCDSGAYGVDVPFAHFIDSDGALNLVKMIIKGRG